MNRTLLFLASLILVAGCGNGEGVDEVVLENNPPELTFEPGGDIDMTAKPQGPVEIAYRIIGTPIVGQPLGIDLQVTSVMGQQDVTLSYRVNDSTAMQLTEAQPASVSILTADADAPSQQQVRVVPLREGRLFLNVSASVDTDNGTLSTVTAIPIQVGAAPRGPQGNGALTTDEDGNPIRSLPATEN